MNECINTLIEIFAHCDIDNLRKDQDYIELCTKNNGEYWFDAKRKRIEMIKQFLEQTVKKQSSLKNQVIEALKLLNRMDTEEKIDICYALIVKGYSNQWKPNQLNHFKKYYNALRNNYDYFLSFTDRNPTPEYDNYINANYKYLIKRVLGNEFRKANQKKNLLAEALNCLLQRKLLKGFFYPQEKGDNQKVKNKLKSACEECFVFIQIIQNIMFTSNNEINYCHLEYCHACQCLAHKKGFIFLLAEKSHNSLQDFHRNVCIDYDEWYRDILGRDKIILEPTEMYNQQHISKMITIFNENVVDQVEKIKWEIIEDVPD